MCVSWSSSLPALFQYEVITRPNLLVRNRRLCEQKAQNIKTYHWIQVCTVFASMPISMKWPTPKMNRVKPSIFRIWNSSGYIDYEICKKKWKSNWACIASVEVDVHVMGVNFMERFFICMLLRMIRLWSDDHKVTDMRLTTLLLPVIKAICKHKPTLGKLTVIYRTYKLH